MKFLKPGLSLALLGAGLAFVPASPSAAGGLAQAPADPHGVAAMRTVADGNVRITEESATGAVGFIAARGARADLYPAVDGDGTAAATAKTDAYLDQYGAAFGASDGELERTGVMPSRYGWTVSYVQEHQGVEVFASRLKANVDEDGDLVSVSGFVVPDLDVPVEPRVSAAEAAEAAVSYVEVAEIDRERGPAMAGPGLEAVSEELVIYRKGALKGEDTGEDILAYLVEVTGPEVRDMVVVDATTRKPVNHWTTVTDALERELYETSPAPEDLVWAEGDDFPALLNPDQQNLVRSAGESYWLYQNAFGYDSYDGEGAVMRTVNNDPGIQCPNANWNGATTNYCDGVTSDDVVAHEWAHAYTEYTSGLIYQYQSGALNEAYSDVWGETLDLVNGREDEDETFDVKRTDGECAVGAPAQLEVNIIEPPGVAGPCTAAFGFGPSYTTAEVETDVVVATDAADATGPSTTDGCTAFVNADEVAGAYAYVDRGTCTFQAKADNAVAAGATGLIVGHNAAGLPTTMSATSTIPATMITQSDGARVKAAGRVTMTIRAEDVSTREASTRWLVGEKSEAFGGAIRDMWKPTCYGDPGKVSDAEYNCDPNFTDNGGVHGNSGVPNHAYALMVDGGEYHGTSIQPIGLDQAAAIWWRAQTAYLAPSSDFVAAADALEQSCADLVGEPINVLTTEPEATPVQAEPITDADCTQVTAALDAVEMRAEPVQCNFQPLLQQGAPSLCGPGFDQNVVFSEDFEDGLSGWSAEQEIARIPKSGYEGGFGAPWEIAEGDEVLGDHDSAVARGPAPDLGSCTGDGEDDFSSRDSIVSPEITLPDSGLAPTLSFEHYVATEGGYDGGNMKLSVNGGDFTVIPAAAYTFNAPSDLLSLEEGNTNPLAGEDAFTGTDAGEVVGSWGESQVDLGALEVGPGDTLRLRVDIGRDGCGGLESYSAWLVDNITVSLCEGVIDTSTTVVRTVPRTIKPGQRATVVVSVQAEGAPVSTGTVEIRAGDDVLGSARVDNGTATVDVGPWNTAGEKSLLAVYTGADGLGSSSTTFTIDVAGKDKEKDTSTGS